MVSEVSEVSAVLDSSRVVLCAGPGGVGKTTTSASLALGAAIAGKKVCVLTIDPARRLADALGLKLDNEPHQVDCGALVEEGLVVEGELWAMMLDPVKTFDELIHRIAPSQAVAHKLLDNVIYRQMSRALAGTLEYTAVEKLYGLYTHSDFDLIIVDTPPSKNVLDFLESPEWISRFMDETVLKWFSLLEPGASASGVRETVIKKTGRVVWEVFERLLGRELTGHLTEFMRAVTDMASEFRKRGDGVQGMLRSSDCSFLVVATPGEWVLRDATFLCEEIQRRGISFGGFVLNRTRVGLGIEELDGALNKLREAGEDSPSAGSLVTKLRQLVVAHEEEARHDLAAIERLRREASWEGFLGILPRQIGEINDLPSLWGLARQLQRGGSAGRVVPSTPLSGPVS
ncbi:MAG: ArsA family ATPase [Myxococcota bacterium]|nr:ArsA family ATPase [Myxococcota bacterium]